MQQADKEKLIASVIEFGGIALWWWESVGKDRHGPEIVNSRIAQIRQQIAHATALRKAK
jgi:hypothetical protein